MSVETLLADYGYPALWLGTFLEGETILVLGGLAAHQGYLNLKAVIVIAFAGSLMGDQLFFFLGRHYSRRFLSKFQSWQPRIDKVHSLLDRHETFSILAFRFFYGLRSVTPFVLGMSKVPIFKFALLNAIGALVWATVVGTGGYYFGYTLKTLLGEIKHYEVLILWIVIGLGAAIWFGHFWRQRRSFKPAQRKTTASTP